VPTTNRRPFRKQLALKLASLPVVGRKGMETYLRRKYGARVVTPAKVENFILAQQEMFDRAVEVRSLPWVLNLDTFSACNLKCPFCPTGTGQIDRKKARLPIEKAKKVIDLVKEHALVIQLYNWGEPFLNPDIFEIIRYAHDAGLFTVINSNLSIRVDDLAKKIVDSRLDRLQASVDGISQEALEVYRRKSEAKLVFDNVRAIADERIKQGVDHPVLDLAFLVFSHNEHEIDQLNAKQKEIGSDAFAPRRAFIFHDDLIPKHKDYQPLHAIFNHTCEFLYSELTVEATGVVSPCCTNMSEKWDLGPIEDITSLIELWNNPTYLAMRAVNAGKSTSEYLAPGEKTLCETCGLVDHPEIERGHLSPLPPSFVADGMEFDHKMETTQTIPSGSRR